MIYLLKSSMILGIFYTIYIFLLRKETFFQANRCFLIMGLISSFALPFVIISNYVEVESTVALNDLMLIAESSSPLIEAQTDARAPLDFKQEQVQPFNYIKLMSVIYLMGLVVFFLKFSISLLSLSRFLNSFKSVRKNNMIYHQTKSDIAPFSFFRHIVYNPNHFNKNELKIIINHEIVHAQQWHSIDVLLAQLTCVILWFNPLAWVYKRVVQQNLEFIADRGAEKFTNNGIYYKKLLLKLSVPSNQLKLVNSFYTSLIKKRITMLQKTKSEPQKKLKLLMVVPFLIVFLMSFNQKTVLVPIDSKITSMENQLNSQTNNLEIFFDKDMTDKYLEETKLGLSQRGINFKYSKIKRNKKGEVTGLNVQFEKDGRETNYKINASSPIEPFYFVMSKDKFEIKNIASSSNPKMSKSYNNQKTIMRIEDTTAYKMDLPEKKMTDQADSSDSGDEVVNKEQYNLSGLTVLTNGGKYSASEANLINELFIVVDGNDYSENSLKDINPQDIEDMTVLKAEEALKYYGTKAKNGAIVIRTKDYVKNIQSIYKDEIEVYREANGKIVIKGKNAPNVIFIVDGETIEKAELEKLDKNQIKTVRVLKGVEAVEQFGAKASDGVVMISTRTKSSLNVDTPQADASSNMQKTVGPNQKRILNKNALYIINETKSSYNEFLKLKPEYIKSLFILEEEKALEIYGKSGKRGAVLVETILEQPNSKSIGFLSTDLHNKNEPVEGSSNFNSSKATSSVEYIIDKNATDEFIESQVIKLNGQGLSAKINRIRRNNLGLITGIKISLSDEKGQKSSSSWKSSNEPIPDIIIGKSIDGNLILRELD